MMSPLSELKQELISTPAVATVSAQAAERRPAPLTVRIEAITEEHLAGWRQLERRIGEVPLAVSSDWTETWLNHYGGVVPARVALGETDGMLRGICLVTEGVGRHAGPFPLRTRHIGTAGERHGESVCVEYNSLLVEDRFRDSFASGVIQVVLQESSFDALHLDGFRESELPIGRRNDAGFELTRRSSRYFDLRATRDAGADVLERLGRSTRSKLRRTLKKYGELDIQWAESIDEADEILTELTELHQARWQSAGEHGAFAAERFREFQRELAVRLVPQRRAVLFRVRHQGATVGCLMLLVDRGRMLDYLSGFAPFDEKPSPGIVTHYLCMQEALLRGFDAYDFLVGDKRHKENLSTDSNELVWAVHQRPTGRNRLVGCLRKARRFVRGTRRSATEEEAE